MRSSFLKLFIFEHIYVVLRSKSEFVSHKILINEPVSLKQHFCGVTTVT
jgi:hypothetical protein